MNSILKTSLYLAILLTGSMASYSQPLITQVDKTEIDQGIITLQGSGFGEGPKIEVYDDFEHEGATSGEPIALNKAITGSWEQEHSQYYPLYDSMSLSGNHSMLAWNNDIPYSRQINHSFENPIQSTYISYWVAIPKGYPFPGNDADVGGFSSDSSWKLTWLYDESRSGADSDLCIPTHVGSGKNHIGGNDLMLAHLPDFQDWWSWGKWMRITILLKADPADPTGKGYYRYSTWSQEHGEYVQEENIPVFDADGPEVKEYNRVSFPGWFRGFTNGEGRPLYDDIYVASGENAYARVELTNNTNYTQSTEFSIQLVKSWTDTEITFQLVDSAITNIDDAHIHLFSGDGENQTTLLRAPPMPPSDLSATVK